MIAIHLFIVAFGLGALPSFVAKVGLGMRLFLGLLLIPLFLTLATLPFGLPLDVASRAISIVSGTRGTY